ncbi:hypothetical protein VE03_08648 [Pseudogymnoascus sp. 23342-1-I1]|nr:hypothetical protein VE03_08648 [Pseudogymnoascus sp. 23342-1-I1]
MKSSYSSLVAGLVVLLVTCSAAPYVTPVGDELYFIPENGFAKETIQVEKRTINLLCLINPIYDIFKTPPRSAEASSFCTNYIRPTSTLTSTSTNVVVLTELTTLTETKLTTTVATATIATVTELCATPTAPVTCGFEALGFGANFISSASGVSGLACHRLCLVTANCESFQIRNSDGNCNLFNQPTEGNVQPAPGSGFTFYDRDCTDLLPLGCALPPAKFKRTWPLPPWLVPNPESKISAACTCLITSAPPATTSTVIVPVTTVTITTDVILTTELSVQTDTTDVTYVTYTTVT